LLHEKHWQVGKSLKSKFCLLETCQKQATDGFQKNRPIDLFSVGIFAKNLLRQVSGYSIRDRQHGMLFLLEVEI
jgi:hypothetical protein